MYKTTVCEHNHTKLNRAVDCCLDAKCKKGQPAPEITSPTGKTGSVIDLQRINDIRAYAIVRWSDGREQRVMCMW